MVWPPDVVIAMPGGFFHGDCDILRPLRSTGENLEGVSRGGTAGPGPFKSQMNVFPITFTRAQRIERKAKARRKGEPGLNVAASLDIEAREDGFLHWKHVTLCRSLWQSEKSAKV